MASESIRFDFLSTGADKLAGDFKKTGDSAAAASRGAKVLQDVIKTLGDKEDRTAVQSATLAKALRLTGDAEDRAAAKAVAADAAIRRLDDALQKEERDALEAAAANRVLGASFDKLAEKAGGPSLTGALAALTPALIPLTGGIAAGVAAVGVSFAAAAVGAGAFAALAKTAFSQVSKAADAYQKAQAKVAATPATAPGATQAQLASAKASLAAAQAAQQNAKGHAAQAAAQARVTAAQARLNQLENQGSQVSKQRTAALKAEQQALAGLTGPQRELVKSIIGIKTEWKSLSVAVATPVLAPWLDATSKLLSHLRPLVQPVADQFRAWGQAVDRYFSSSAGSAEITRLATAFGRFSADQLSALGVFLTDAGKAIFNLGRDLAAHNVDFGAFSAYLDQWGGAFLRWSSSAAARQDVTKFLAFIRTDGPEVKDLLKNLGGVLKTFAPGLSSVGSLELRLISDFLGFLARTPQSIAKPLVDTAGALLLLQKTGVLKVGIKIVGAAVKWLTGGVISIGSGAAAAGEIRAAFASGGAAAAAEIRAALAGGAAAGGAGGIGGGAAAGAAAGKAAGGGFLTALRAAITPAAAGVIAGALIRAAGDTLSPAGTFAGKLNKNFQDDGHLWSTTLLHSFTFGGLEAWLTAKIGLPAGKALNNVGAFIHGSWTKTENDTKSIWGSIGGFLSGSWHKLVGDSGSSTGKVRNNFSGMSDTILGAMRRAGQATDAFRTQNLLPVLGTAGRVSGGIQGLQHSINLLHGKTVNVGVHASGSGGMTFTQKVASSISSGGFSLRSLASGGRITAGSGPTADDVPILASRGETVVSASHSKKLASAFRAVGVPGYASGGIAGTVPWTAGAEYDFGRAAESALLRAEFAQLKATVAAAARAKAAAASAAAVGALGGPNSASAAQAQAYARSRLGAYGWGVVQMNPLIALWNRESGWNRLARNPSSGAYGIPQSLPASKMGAAANPPTSSAAAQINWGLSYIKGRYGSPAGAWGHEVAFNWYDRGGLLKPGLTLALNTSGRAEQVIPAGGAGGGAATIVLENRGVIGSQAELEQWLVRSLDNLKRKRRI